MRDPANMKVTPAKRKLLRAMLRHEGDQEACFKATYALDPNGTCYCSLQEYGMVCPPGVLTPRGRELAVELQGIEDDAEQARKPIHRPQGDF